MFLGIDIGGTSVKLGLVDGAGAIHARTEVSVCFDGYQTPILTTVIRAAKDFLCQEKAAIQGVGISATGQIDQERGIVIGTNGKIPHYEGARLKADVEQAMGVPAWALNDANAAALGELFIGGARGYQNVVMLTLGTGVGGGLILNARLYGGMQGIAGELGHFTLYQDGVACPCGKRGCLEQYASTTALVARAERLTDRRNLNGRLIFEGVAQGDSALQQALNGWLDDVAAGITGLVHIFNPELVLIGGGVSAQEVLLLAPLRTRVLSGVMPRFAERLRIERAVLGNDAGMIGAVKYLMDRSGFSPDNT